ncbi:MAG: proline--tRNA ligase [Candidatus Melainabacteria bacterium]|nr:proline--tRNA ligase [Candidatus Melainabacteria bacterium]
MRWSQMFIPTLREEPANVEAASHRLLVRAGYIRQLTAGVYSLLPLGQRVRLKVIEIIRQEMNNIGGQEFALSALQPLELWDESGRRDAVANIMFRFQDRKGSELALGLTHEEVFTSIARASLDSYKQLPQTWYQIQTKFRDEARPKGGLLRVREFTMKDSYSFDLDNDGLDRSFQQHHAAYCRIFNRCGLSFRAVEASSGAMGGSNSIEFMVLTEAGEDTLVLCRMCDYAANLERAESKIRINNQQCTHEPLIEFATPGIRTIRELEQFPTGAPASQQIKTLVYSADGYLVLALLQGDQELNETKLQSVLGAAVLRQASDLEIVEALGAQPGSLGACAVRTGSDQNIRQIVADQRLRGRMNMITGANKDDFHLRGVSVERDIMIDQWADLHTVRDNEECTKCGNTLMMTKGLEIGHIFKLGTRYSESMNAGVLGPEGIRKPLVMGSYGIGVERLIAAVAELCHDEQGLTWPVSVAPFEVLVLPVNVKDKQQLAVAEKIHTQLKELSMDSLLDDRDERAGVKFNDADLIGVPYRITVGKKIDSGQVELTDRTTRSTVNVSVQEAAHLLKEKLVSMHVK